MTEDEIKQQLANMVSDEATDTNDIPDQTPDSEYKEGPICQ